MALSHVGFTVWLVALSTGASPVSFTSDHGPGNTVDSSPRHVVRTMRLGAVGTSQTSGGAKPPASTQNPRGSLEGTAWNAIELTGTAVSGDVEPPDRRPHLVFGAAGQLSGSDGCNRLTGPYTVKENGISFGQIAGTLMACPKTDEIAKRFRAALKGTSHWSIVNERLEFYGATGKPLAVFERRPATAREP